MFRLYKELKSFAFQLLLLAAMSIHRSQFTITFVQKKYLTVVVSCNVLQN